MGFDRDPRICTSPNEFGAPLAHDPIGPYLHGIVAGADRFGCRRDLGQANTKRHECMRCCVSDRNRTGRVRWIELHFHQIDSGLLSRDRFAGRKGHGLGQYGFAFQVSQVLDGVVSSRVDTAESHGSVQPSLVGVSRRQWIRRHRIRFHGFVSLFVRSVLVRRVG